jgi:predicted aspartyl protease
MNQKPQLFANILRIGLLLAASIYFFTHIDLSSLNFPGLTTAPQPQHPSHAQVESDKMAVPNSPGIQPQAEPNAATPELDAGNFYTYTDDQGIIHMVNDLEKVPQHYRNRMKVTRGGNPRAYLTPVVITGNQVLVPVILTFRGRSVEARLLLDTGANITTINEGLAGRLGIEASDLRQGRATVADGRSVSGYSFAADSLGVDSRTRDNVWISILPGSGGKGYDGLLGMDFLKYFRYHVDFDRSVIEWGS